MNVKLFLFTVALVLLVSGCQTSNPSTPASSSTARFQSTTHYIDISNFAYSNPDITIKKGDVIVWTNRDSFIHTVTSDSGNYLSSPTLSNGQNYTQTFNDIGTFSYHCSIHPAMKGKVTVINS